jgi:hypothetical protein
LTSCSPASPKKRENFLVDTTYLLQMIGKKKLGRVLGVLVVG